LFSIFFKFSDEANQGVFSTYLIVSVEDPKHFLA
jgi:hypothetical protein